MSDVRKPIDRLTDHGVCIDPWEACGQDKYCKRGCHDPGGCCNGCNVPKLYWRLYEYEETGLTPEEVATLKAAATATPPNRPLNLAQVSILDRNDAVWVRYMQRNLICCYMRRGDTAKKDVERGEAKDVWIRKPTPEDIDAARKGLDCK